MRKSMFVLLGVFILLFASLVFAYSLQDFPRPFVTDGLPAPNLVIIVGDDSAASDVLGAIDVALALQGSAVSQTFEKKLPSKIFEGESIPVAARGRLLAINDFLGNVRESFTELDSDLLKGGTITTGSGATTYSQYLRLSNSSGQIIFDRNSKGFVDSFLSFASGAQIFEWQLKFDSGLVSRIDGNELPDLHDEELMILGQPMAIVDTDFTESTGRLVLKLMGGAVAPILSEGGKAQYKVGDKNFVVEVIALSTTANGGAGSVKFRINGDITNELKRGDVTALADGTYVGIRSILPSGKETQKSIVQFYLGANYITLEDRKITDTFNTTGVKVNGITVPAGYLRIDGKVPVANKTVSIDSIRYALNAEPLYGEVFIPPNKGLRDFLKTSEGMLVPGWDVYFNGLSKIGESLIKFSPVSEQKYLLQFTNQENIFYELPLLTAQNNCLRYGDENDDLWFIESDSATTYYGTVGDFFVLSKCSVSSNKNICNTHVVKFKSADTSNTASGNLRLYFVDLGAGEKDVALSMSGSDFTGTLSAGDGSYTIHADTVMNPNGLPNISIDVNGDGAFNNGEAVVATIGGALIDFGADNNNESNLEGRDARVCANPSVSLTTLSKEFDKAEGNEVIPFVVESRASNTIGIQTPISASSGFFSGLKQSKPGRHKGLSGYGDLFELYDPGGTRSETLSIYYPDGQRGADVSVGKQAAVVEIAKDFVSEEERAPESVKDVLSSVGKKQLSNIVKFVSEIDNVRDYNSILVGGACVNQLSAQLQGNPLPCWESIAKDVAVIQSYAFQNGNIALLVAGMSAADTRRATTALATGLLKNINASSARITQGSGGKIDVVAT